MNTFPSRMFRWAAIYGVIVLTPLYFTPLPELGGEVLLGFIGLALALCAQGYPIAPPVAGFAAIDLALGLGFLLTWQRTLAEV